MWTTFWSSLLELGQASEERNSNLFFVHYLSVLHVVQLEYTCIKRFVVKLHKHSFPGCISLKNGSSAPLFIVRSYVDY